MSTLVDYKQLQVVSPDPTGAGGLALNDNFSTLADCIGPCNYTATADPASSDNQSTGYYPGSRWFNTTTSDEFVCISSTMSTAVWEKTTGGNSAPTLQQVTDAGNATTDDISVANLFLTSGDTLSVDNIVDAGSGTITIGTSTVVAGNSWSIDTEGNGTFTEIYAGGADFLGSVSVGSINGSLWNVDTSGTGTFDSLNAGLSTIYALNTGSGENWAIDGSGEATFNNVVGSSGSWSIYGPGYAAFTSLSISSGSASIDSSGNGTFTTVTDAAGSFTIDSSGDGTFANGTFGGSLSVASGSATIDSGGNGTFTTLTDPAGSFTIDSSGDGTFANGTFGSLSVASGSASIDSSGNGTFTTLTDPTGSFTIDSGGDATFANGKFGGSLTVGSGAAVIDASGDGTFANLTAINVSLAIGATLSIDNLTDAGSGSITIDSALSATNWAINTAGDSTLNSIAFTGSTVEFVQGAPPYTSAVDPIADSGTQMTNGMLSGSTVHVIGGPTGLQALQELSPSFWSASDTGLPAGTSDRTIHILTRCAPGGQHTPWAYGTSGSDAELGIHIESNVANVILTESVSPSITGTTDICDNNWHRLILRITSGFFELFLDPTSSSTNLEVSASPTFNTVPGGAINVGALLGGMYNDIDTAQLAIYDRAWSDDEVKESSSGTLPIGPLAVNPVVDTGSEGVNGSIVGSIFVISGPLSMSALQGSSSSYWTASDSGLPSGNGARSVNMWINIPNGSSDVFSGIWWGTDNSSNDAWGFYVASGKVYYNFNPSHSGYPGTATVNDGDWHNIWLTYDGIDTAHVYVDPTSSAANLDNTVVQALTTVLSGTLWVGAIFGQEYSGITSAYISIYNRNVTDSEIKASYDGTLPSDAIRLYTYSEQPAPEDPPIRVYTYTEQPPPSTGSGGIELLNGPLGVNNLVDAGSGSITIGSSTAVTGNSWRIDTSGDATFANGTFGGSLSIASGSASIDSSGNGTFTTLTDPVGSFTIDSSGDATFANGAFAGSLSIASGSATIDSSGNGTFTTVTDSGGSFTIDSSGDATFANGTFGGSLTIASGSATIDFSGNGTFTTLTDPAGSFTIDSSGDATFANGTFAGSLFVASGSASIDSSGDGTFANLTVAGSLAVGSGFGFDSSGNLSCVTLTIDSAIQGSSSTVLASFNTIGADNYYTGGSGSITVQSPTLLNAMTVLGTIDSADAGIVAGQIGYDPSTNKAYVWDGTAWNALW